LRFGAFHDVPRSASCRHSVSRGSLQLVRADFQSQGRRFETCPAHWRSARKGAILSLISSYCAWPEVACVPLFDTELCTLAIVRRREVADPVVDELITLAQQIVAHAAHCGTPYSDVARS
jgi:hypothetical protein